MLDIDRDSDEEVAKVKLPAHKIFHSDIPDIKTVKKIIECKPL
jgi:hypothetical protein